MSTFSAGRDVMSRLEIRAKSAFLPPQGKIVDTRLQEHIRPRAPFLTGNFPYVSSNAMSSSSDLRYSTKEGCEHTETEIM